MATAATQHTEGNAGLTLEQARHLFSNEMMAEDSNFSVIRTYYHPNVRFRDAVQEIHGREAFIEMMRRFMERCEDFDVTLNDSAQNGNVIFLQWTMGMRFGGSRAPKTKIEGATKLTLDANSKVIEHRDYFDLWGDTLDAVPVLGPLYRKVMKKLG